MNYRLTIEVPDDIDPDVMEDIMFVAEEHDTTDEQRIGRWIGGILSDVEHALSNALPEGWRARIEQP